MENLTLNVDENLKEQAEELFSELGLSMSDACSMFMAQSVKEQKIPFSVSYDVPNEDTLKAIDNVKNRRNLSKEFSSVKDLMEDLNAED
jgi:DNA-damage-inducible protein J